MGKITDKKYVAFLLLEKEGIQETLLPEEMLEPSTVLPEVHTVLPKVDLEIDKPEEIDPRYEGLEEVYFQDTEGKSVLIPRAYQIKRMGEFTPPCKRETPLSIFSPTGELANMCFSAYKDDPNKSRSHPEHYFEK